MAKYHRVTFTFNGKRYERKGKTLKEASAKAERLLMSLESGEIGFSGKMTVSKWIDEWLRTYKAQTVGKGQYINLVTYTNTIKKAIGAKSIKDVRDIDLQKIINQEAVGRNGKPRSHSYILKIRSTIKAVFSKARVSRLIPFDPSEDLELPKCKDNRRRSITEAERKAILDLAKTHPAGLWIKTMLYCGLRPGEARALEWRHVDLDNKLIHIEQAMKAKSKDIDTPKSAARGKEYPNPQYTAVRPINGEEITT
ncbi:MAG: tyrosine-type recombinase/integrase [Oscillospiraceae bacterium]|jgi:integrase|nr:tyrosine-type recombinase/integrase [Oscillospiraceae bacterium]